MIFNYWATAANDSVILSIARGVKSADTDHPITIELNYVVSESLDDPNWWPILTVNGVYTYYPTYDESYVAYNKSNFLPDLFLEEHYEYATVGGELGTPNVLRRQEYWSLTAGCLAGYMSGNYYTERFASNWQSYLNSPGMAQLRVF